MRISPAQLDLQRVDRATADVLTGAAVAIFTIATGNVWLHGLIGEVTTVLGAGANNGSFQFNPTTGTTIAMCAATDILTDEAGSLYSLTGGAASDSMTVGSSGAVRTGLMGNPILLGIGDIEFLTSANVTGSVSFQAWWTPAEDGATLVAA
mgnify:CR=1 FL=1